MTLTIDLKDGLNNETTEFVKQVLADFAFYLTLNFVGLYVRYVGEINMRRGFLDKRGCIETTFKLKYEKEQEVKKRVLHELSFYSFVSMYRAPIDV